MNSKSATSPYIGWFLYLFYIQVITGSSLVELNDKPSDLTKNPFNQNIDAILFNIGSSDDKTDESIKTNLKKLNKVLVKRLVPHDKLPKLEYIDDYKAYYKPLVRIHNVKKTPLKNVDFNTVLKPFLDNTKPKGISNYNKRNLKNKLLKSLLDIAKRVPESKNKADLIKLVSRLIGNRVLRENQFEKSVEEDTNVSKHDDHVEHKKLWLPYYSIWNGWTYHTTIYTDECPPNQLKLHNLCVWAPPH